MRGFRVNRWRWLPVVGLLVGSLGLAFFVRDVIQRLVVAPLSYFLWQAAMLYWAIPQVVKWFLLVFSICLAVLWRLIPEWRPRHRKTNRQVLQEGSVESLAVWLSKGRNSNYFKWQLANRLGLIARKLHQNSGQLWNSPARSEAMDRYFDAGLEHSFVDFPSPRSRFERRRSTPLDLDPSEVVNYLESQMEIYRGQHDQSL